METLMKTGMKDRDLRRYEDMLNLPHHVSSVHPQMSISDRAAQFAPFAALTGYAAAIQEEARLTDELADLDEDSLTILNQRLELLEEHLAEHPQITVTFFVPDEQKDGGAYRSVSGAVRKIDVYDRTLLMMDGTRLPLRYVMQMDGELFDE